jgi:hypothetical protein
MAQHQATMLDTIILRFIVPPLGTVFLNSRFADEHFYRESITEAS